LRGTVHLILELAVDALYSETATTALNFLIHPNFLPLMSLRRKGGHAR
jgi:hypothetical protein